MKENLRFHNKFLTHSRFQWQSQNPTRQLDTHGQLIHDHEARGVAVHLFVRAWKKEYGTAAPFVYCGPIRFESWQGEEPITVNWTLTHTLSDRLMADFSTPAP